MRSIGRYCEALDGGLAAKIQTVSPWVRAEAGRPIVDVGSGTGAIAAQLAQLCSDCPVVGIDCSRTMVGIAAGRHADGRPNLRFQWGTAGCLPVTGAASVVFSSVLHEVYSYLGHDLRTVLKALKAAWNSLAPGGRLVIRDFVRPPDASRQVLLRHRRDDIVPGHDFVSFCRGANRSGGEIPRVINERWIEYRTDLGAAFEFIYRKDYHEMWRAELRETYGFWSMSQARYLLGEAGFSLIRSQPLASEWLHENSFEGRIEILDGASREPLAIPNGHALLVGERPVWPSPSKDS